MKERNTRGRRPRSLRRRCVLLALMGFAAVPATQCMRQDEVECEEAVAELVECCPGFDRSAVYCQYNDVCGVSYPDLAPDESECILDKKCSQIRDKQICERVMARGADAKKTRDEGLVLLDSGVTYGRGTSPTVCE